MKDCPLCKGTPLISPFSEAVPYEPSTYYAGERLSCKCGLTLKEYRTDDNEKTLWDEHDKGKVKEAHERLTKRWNTRPAFDALAKERDGLKELVRQNETSFNDLVNARNVLTKDRDRLQAEVEWLKARHAPDYTVENIFDYLKECGAPDKYFAGHPGPNLRDYCKELQAEVGRMREGLEKCLKHVKWFRIHNGPKLHDSCDMVIAEAEYSLKSLHPSVNDNPEQKEEV